MNQLNASQLYQKAIRVFIGLFIVQALLLATHRGEFWPWSIFPMFSKAGHTWTRGLVVDVSDAPEGEYWQMRQLDNMPGEVFALNRAHVNQNDVSNFLQKAGDWSDQKNLNAMRHLFLPEVESGMSLLLYKVNGSLMDKGTDAERGELKYTPFILMNPEGAYLNPSLK